MEQDSPTSDYTLYEQLPPFHCFKPVTSEVHLMSPHSVNGATVVMLSLVATDLLKKHSFCFVTWNSVHANILYFSFSLNLHVIYPALSKDIWFKKMDWLLNSFVAIFLISSSLFLFQSKSVCYSALVLYTYSHINTCVQKHTFLYGICPQQAK